MTLHEVKDIPSHAGKSNWLEQSGVQNSLEDVRLRDYRAPQLTLILHNVFPHVSKTSINQYRIQYQRGHGRRSLLTEMIQETENAGLRPAKRPSKPAEAPTEEIENVITELKDFLTLWQRHLEYEGTLNNLKPVEEGKGYICTICYDNFPTEHVIFCSATSKEPTEAADAACSHCFNRYCKETLGTESLDHIKCPACPSLFSKNDVESHLSEWDLINIRRADHQRTCNVAFNSNVQMTLWCQCGTVAIVEKEDAGSGIVQCTCNRCYCIQCGNFEHPGSLCPPPSETLKWLEAHSKPCPNCGHAIEKSAGCNHMTCSRRAGGCGHQFCWLCFTQWGGCRCPIFD
jgi:hypothetical protein